jgi:hypothetical protein
VCCTLGCHGIEGVLGSGLVLRCHHFYSLLQPMNLHELPCKPRQKSVSCSSIHSIIPLTRP